MHIVKIPDDIAEPIPVANGSALEPGERYLCSNAFAGSLLGSRWRVLINGEMWSLRSLLEVQHWAEVKFDPRRTEPIQDLWLVRAAGWGDLLMLTPTIRALQKKYPNIKIHVACGKTYVDLLWGLDVIIEEIPIKLPVAPNTCIVTYEDWIEGNPRADQIHMAQHFADKVGIDLKGDHRPSYFLKDEETQSARMAFPRTNRKRVAIQVMASAVYRTYPFMPNVVTLLYKKGCEVFLFGEPGQLKTQENSPAEIVNLTNQNLTFRQSAAVLAQCDVAISPDSAMVHLASALDVPCVGLYGPISPELRGSGRKMKGIAGIAPCAPCFFHAQFATDFPAGMPCIEAKCCVALKEITPEEIVENALKIAGSPIIQLR